MSVVKLNNGAKEILTGAGDFACLIEMHMGQQVMQYFWQLMNDVEEERKELKSTRSEIESQTLALISQVKFLREDDRENFAEEFRAIMEDIFGLEE